MNTENYFTPFEWVLEKFCFNYLGHSYTGRGILRWNPESGFHIEGPLKRHGFSQPESIAMGRARVISESEKSSIYMRPWYFRCGFTPKIPLIDREDVISQKRLSINFEKACFSTSFEPRNKSDNISGHSLYEIGDTDSLFDFVDKGGIKISGNILIGETRYPQGGIFHTGEQGEKIQGFLKRKKYLELYWSFPKSTFTKAYCWRWSENVKYSLSILLGRTVEILSREMTCDNKTRLEILKAQPIDSLNFLSLLNYKYGKDESSKNKTIFLNLTDFFASKKDFYQVGINIFKQVAEASRQKNWQTRELLLSTILEAALRNIDNQPFHSKKMTGWNVGKGLKKFLETYLVDDSWVKLHSRIMKEHTFLRDRNAHPDWLFDKGGYLSVAEKEQALDSMIFLSQFYGYMILSLAGVEDLKPVFPLPHRQWGPTYNLQPAKLREEITNKPDELFD